MADRLWWLVVDEQGWLMAVVAGVTLIKDLINRAQRQKQRTKMVLLDVNARSRFETLPLIAETRSGWSNLLESLRYNQSKRLGPNEQCSSCIYAQAITSTIDLSKSQIENSILISKACGLEWACFIGGWGSVLCLAQGVSHHPQFFYSHKTSKSRVAA